MRIGKGAGPSGQNLQVIPFQERADFNLGAMTPETRVWQVVDIFTTGAASAGIAAPATRAGTANRPATWQS